MVRALASVSVVLLVAAGAFYFIFNQPQTESNKFSDAGSQPPPAPLQPPLPPIAPPLPPPAQPIVQPPAQAPEPMPPAPPVVHPRSRQTVERHGKRTYVVRPGDTLSSISVQYFGSADRYPQIAKLNGVRANRIRPGQVLLLPDAPAEPAVLPDPPVETVDRIIDAPADRESEHFDPQPPTLSVKKQRP